MYDGEEERPTITLALDRAQGDELTLSEGSDFDVEFSGDTVNPGTVTVLITDKGDYAGTIETSFTILPGDLSHATVDVIPDAARTGQPIEPKPTVKMNGHLLMRDVDYTVAYSDNVDEGTATLVITGMGNCTGDVRATFEIVEESEEKRVGDAAALALALAALAAAAATVIATVGLRREARRR